ncbi:MAG: SGNH/GDSL hydrolase family protein [Neisseriaceae bacterium]
MKKYLCSVTLALSLGNAYAVSLLTIPPLLSERASDMAELGPQQKYEFPEQHWQGIRHGYEFNSIVALGDSITDEGSSGRLNRYIAGGYASPLYIEHLSNMLTGKAALPATLGGENYAVIGATYLQLEQGRTTLQQQYKRLLRKQGAQLDRNALYILWGGNMDLEILAGGAIGRILRGQYDLNNQNFTLGPAPQATARLAQKLINHGAPYVVVPNIPNPDLLPRNVIYFTSAWVGLLTQPFSLPTGWFIKQIATNLDNYLRDPSHLIPAQGQDFIRINRLQALHSQLYWMLPMKWVAALYDRTAFIQNRIVDQYNHSLNRALSRVKGNIVYFDFKALLEEVAYHYKDYGLDTVLVPTCTLGYSSRFCNRTSPHYHYTAALFSDSAHPSPEFHLMIAQTIESILTAPVYVSAIIKQLDNINTSRQFFVDSQLDRLKLQTTNRVSHPTLLLGYSGSTNQSNSYYKSRTTYTNLLNLGAYTYLRPKWLMGSFVSLGFGVNQPFKGFVYHFNHQNLTWFTQYSPNQHLWFNLNFSLGRIKANDIIRSVQIYKKNIKTSGATEGIAFSTLATLGVNLSSSTQVDKLKGETGPLFQIGLNRFKVSAYQESGKKFLAMNYKGHHYTKNFIGAGWYYQHPALNIATKPVSISFAATINRRLGEEKFEIPSGLTTAPIKFKRVIRDTPRSWIQARLALETRLNQNTTVSAGLGINSDLKGNNKNFQYSVTLKQSF